MYNTGSCGWTPATGAAGPRRGRTRARLEPPHAAAEVADQERGDVQVVEQREADCPAPPVLRAVAAHAPHEGVERDESAADSEHGMTNASVGPQLAEDVVALAVVRNREQQAGDGRAVVVEDDGVVDHAELVAQLAQPARQIELLAARLSEPLAKEPCLEQRLPRETGVGGHEVLDRAVVALPRVEQSAHVRVLARQPGARAAHDTADAADTWAVEAPDQPLEPLALRAAIAVRERDEGAVGESNAVVTGGRRTAVGLGNAPDGLAEGSNDLGSTIFGTVVDDHDLGCGQRLGEQCANGLADVLAVVVEGDDHRYSRRPRGPF